MLNISLTRAKEILNEQGYKLSPTFVEIFMERYDIYSDICYVLEEMVSNDEINSNQKELILQRIKEAKDEVEDTFEAYYDDSEIIQSTYKDILRILIEIYM